MIRHIIALALTLLLCTGCSEEPAERTGKGVSTASNETIEQQNGTNSIGMKFTLIPAGEFLMGAAALESAEIYEQPQHPVRITKPFHFGVYEVTIGQFRRFVAAETYKTEGERDGEGGYGYNAATNKQEGPKPLYTWQNVGWPQTDEHPVVNVSWNDAQAFCVWLSKKEGKAYRLPTEAEWEYAHRAGTKTPYRHGTDPAGLVAIGNIADRAFKAKKPNGYTWGVDADDGYLFTAPVGRFQPNSFGLYDTTGNAWEWCADYYDAAHYRDAKFYGESPAADPQGPAAGRLRVYRGGGWDSEPMYCRSSYRNRYMPNRRSNNIGFRVVLVP